MISISIVLYQTKKEDISNLLSSFETLQNVEKIFIIDNSPSQALSCFFINIKRCSYIHNPSNPGFGAAHNIAFRAALQLNFKYHFVINPDALFNGKVIEVLVNFLEENNDVGMLMPQILNFDGSIQFLPKLLPSPTSILLRKLRKPNFIYEPFIDKYELRFVEDDVIYEAPILSGCFTAFRLEAIRDVGMYDDRFFMYFEDWDLSRRISAKYKTVYFPQVAILHGYESGANKSFFLFKIFIKSAINYFNKWGWIFDKERKVVNQKTLRQFES